MVIAIIEKNQLKAKENVKTLDWPHQFKCHFSPLV